MGEVPKRLVNVRQIANGAMAAGLVLGLAMLALAGWQAYAIWRQGDLVIAGHVPALIGLAGVLIIIASVVGRALAGVLIKIEGNLFHSHDVLLDLQDLMRAEQLKLTEIAENVQLSDATKSIARREKERKALHEAIQDEIIRGNWDAAYYLVDELDKRFGYHGEATRLREEIDAWRGRAKEQRLAQALKQVEAALGKYDWQRARLIAAQIVQVFPDDERATGLDGRIRDAFERRKRDLLTQWQDSVRNHDMEKSLALLKELDHYLTPQEATQLREPVRALFRERLQSLGAQFAEAYRQHQWDRAEVAAERIQAEFPTSKMAAEVRTLIREARERAQAQPAG